MGRHGTGVELRDKSIRIGFMLDGEWVRETLRIPPTPANQRYAVNLVARINKAIGNGTFVYAEFFPDSARAAKSGPQTFGAAADLYVKSIGQLTAATRDQYENAIAEWKAILGASTPLRDITHAELKAKVNGHPWTSPQRMNNALIPLRGTFALVYPGPLSVNNPMSGIGNAKKVKKKPDPLTAAERDRILQDMRERYDPRVYAYFLWMFYTGMRPEEAIALRWSDIDEASGVARVQRVRTFKGSERDGSKTHAERDVDLVPQAMDALRLMKPYTLMKRIERRGEDDTACEIFERPAWHPVKGSGGGRPSEAGPWHDERTQRDSYWKPTLKRLGIRARRSYSTRHTYCTIALRAGVPAAYLAAQAGHSVQTLLSKYALAGAEGDIAKRMMEAAMAPSQDNGHHALRRLR